MSKDYCGDSPKGSRYGENLAFWLYERAEEDQLGSLWESTNREVLIRMAKELETAHFLAPQAIARVLHIREDFLQIILEGVGKGGGHE